VWESHAEGCTDANTVEFGGYAPGPVVNLTSRHPLATDVAMAPSSSAMEFNGSKVS
jgi:hypothetical protein